MELTTVIFRKYPDGNIIALFPYEVETSTYISSYMHVGQHGAADYEGVMADTVPASEMEYEDLYNELTEIGYDLEVKSKRNYDKYLKAYKQTT